MKTIPLYEKITDQIKNLVIERQYSAGQRLPSERELSILFGVGRAAIREALRSLAMIGALEVRYSEGIFIKNIKNIDIMNRVRELIEFARKDEEGAINQALELMKILEIEIISRAVERVSKKDISKLKAILKKMEARVFNAEEYIQSYSEFHKSLAIVATNRVYELLLDAMIISTSGFLRDMASNVILLGNQACYSQLYEIHLHIFEALDEKNSKKAKEAIIEHFQVTESYLERIYSTPVKSVVKNAETEPESLSIGVITFEDIQLTAKKFSGVICSIEESTGKKGNWFFPTSYTSLIEAHIRGFVHIGYYGPRSYLLAHDLSNGAIEVFARAMWGAGPYRKRAKGYHSFLIVSADSPYETINDLEGKTLALTDPISTSGDLIPKVQLGKKLGKKISEYFGKVFHAGGHDAAGLCVLEGQADAAVVADVTMDWAVDAKRYGTKDFRIIWKSSLLPLNAFAWRKDLSPELREKIRKAFISINESDFGKEYLSAVRSDSIVLADDSDFDTIRKALNVIGKWE